MIPIAAEKECIVLAGGMGTRLKPVVSDLPKPMAEVAGKPFLDYIFQYLFKHGVCKTILSVGYKHETILDKYGTFYKNIALNYAIEKEPLGTGGGIRLALEQCSSDHVFILNGDTFFDVSLNDMLEAHLKKEADLTIAVKYMEDFERYGCIQFDEKERVTAFKEKQQTKAGFINGGVYIVKKSFLMSLALPSKFSFESNVMEVCFTEANFYVYTGSSSRYFIDIGIPEDYQKAQIEFKKPGQ